MAIQDRKTWSATVLTLFPEMFPGPLGYSLAGKALSAGLWALETIDIRGFARDRHATVDDTPLGGGPGMVMRPDVVDAALDAVTGHGVGHGVGQGSDDGRPCIYLSPRGRLLDQERVAALAEGPGVVLLAGRYEGLDNRVIEARELEEVSIGDFVLSGGEPAAQALIDACVRLLPGVLGQPDSLEEESFQRGLLEYPHFTRPQDWAGRKVPEVLLSGHHANIRAWRLDQAETVTRERRPDLWARYAARTKKEGPKR